MKITKTGLFIVLSLVSISQGAAADKATWQKGEQVFQYWCATCHGPGPGMPGTSALAAKYGNEKPAPLEQRTDLTPELVKYFVRHGVSVMPFFRKTEISDTDLDALAIYLTRNMH